MIWSIYQEDSPGGARIVSLDAEVEGPADLSIEVRTKPGVPPRVQMTRKGSGIVFRHVDAGKLAEWADLIVDALKAAEGKP